MSPLSHDRSELKQRQQELSRQLADTLLSQDSPIKKANNYQQDWQQHQAVCERQQSLALLDSKLLAVLPGIEQLEGHVAEAQKAVAQEVKALRQFAAELGKTAFAAVVSGDVVATDRFEARKTLHDRLEKLSREKDALGQVDAAKLTEKVKLKARRLKMAGEIKLGQLKIGSLDRALGESLLNEKEEASVDCPQTREVLEAVTGQRAAIATATEQQDSVQSQLADTLDETARTLDRESVEGATVLHAELKQVRKEARSIEKSIVTAREAIVAKALEDETLRDSEQLGPNLKQLWSTQFDLKASQSQVSKTADNVTSRLSTLSQPVKYTICGAAGCLLLILLVVWFGKGDDGTSLSEENQTAESTGATALAALEELGARIETNEQGEIVDVLLHKSEVTDAGLIHLKGLMNLERLYLHQTQITDAGLVNLKGLNKLWSLSLSRGLSGNGELGPKITDTGLVHLKGLTNLKILDLGQTQITDAGLVPLKVLNKLEDLNLTMTKVTDTGLIHLKGLKKLKFLGLALTQVTNAGVANLQKALPNCEIDHESTEDPEDPFDLLRQQPSGSGLP